MTGVPKQSSCQISCWILSALGGALLAAAAGAVVGVILAVALGVAFAAGAALFLQKNVCGLDWSHWGPFEGLKGVPGWDSDDAAAPELAPEPLQEPAAETPVEPAPATPHAPKPNNAPDDLKRLSGVGPKLESLLNEHGITRFDQIAGWTPDDIAEIEAKLSFKGRIQRDDWVAQAKALAGGG